MKTATAFITAIGLLLLASGCKPSNRVHFSPALVSVDPGEGWKRLDIPAAPPVCSPRLMSNTGTINAWLLEEDVTDVKQAVARLQSSVASARGTVQNSLKQESFTTDSGLTGIHLSYTAQPPGSATAQMRSHSFIIRNRRGRCVSLIYITSVDLESAAALESIRKSLRAE